MKNPSHSISNSIVIADHLVIRNEIFIVLVHNRHLIICTYINTIALPVGLHFQNPFDGSLTLLSGSLSLSLLFPMLLSPSLDPEGVTVKIHK